MRFSIVVLFLMYAGCSAQGNQAEYLEDEYVGTHSNGTNHTLFATTPTRAPSPRNRGDLVPTISAAPTPMPPTQRNNNNNKKPTVKPSQQQQQQTSRQPTKDAAAGNVSSVQPTPTPTKNTAAGNVSSVQPTPTPTKAPTRKPTRNPTRRPTNAPTMNTAAGNVSSVQPTPTPTKMPTKNTPAGNVSSVQPTPTPTNAPTKNIAAGNVSPTSTPMKKPTRNPTKGPTKAPTKAPSPPPTTALSSSTPSQSLVPAESSTESASPTEEPILSPSPTAAPIPQPTTKSSVSPSQIPSSQPSLSMVPSASPSSNPSNLPSAVPSGEPSLTPTSTVEPSLTPTSTVVPSLTPTGTPSSVPSVSPSHQPSSLPTLSSVPSASPTNSMMPSLTPTFAPSSIPSTEPSELPSSLPSSIPSEISSSSPSSIPSNVPSESSLPSAVPTFSAQPSAVPSFSMSPSSSIPSEIPSSSPSSIPSNVPSESSLPSAVPTFSSQPSAVPSFSMSPSESGFEVLEAKIGVPVRSATLMDGPTIAVFQTTTLNFLNDYFPADEVTITSVKVTNQALQRRRKLSNNNRNLQVTDLHVNILVKASRLVGDSNTPYPFVLNIQKTFEKHYEVYASRLVDASSFFRVGFRAEANDENASSPRGSPLSGSSLIIVCAIAGCALLTLFIAAFVWRIHSRRASADRGSRSLDLPTSWSHEISASSGYIESPTESDIYTRQQSRRSLFSEMSSQGSDSQRSMLSERSDSPTVGSPYQQTDGHRSIDTNLTNSDRYQPNTNPYSPFASLAPIDENSKMTDIDLSTPRNGRTPRGSEFVEVQKFSGGPTTPRGDHATPKHAKFEDCDVRSPKVAFVKNANTPKGTEFVQLNTSSAVRTGSIIDDLTRFERAWDKELDSKVNAVTETPKANNLERYKKAPRSVLYGGSPDKGIDEMR